MKNVVTAEWIHGFLERKWGSTDEEDDQLGNAFGAAGKTMLAAAALQTKDPVMVARFLGLPTPYVSAVIWNLDRNVTWTKEAYSQLALLMSSSDIDETMVNDVLQWAIEGFWGAEQPRRIDLASLWNSISWFIDEERERSRKL